MGGEDDAQIYRRHAEELIRLATFLVGPTDAPDVVSSAVLRALGSRAWPEVRNHGAYLTRAVQNEALRAHRTRLRREARERRVGISELVDAAPLSPEIVAAVRELSVRQRTVVYLTYWSDLTPKEVAAQLGIGEGSVRRHLARARARLRSVLDG